MSCNPWESLPLVVVAGMLRGRSSQVLVQCRPPGSTMAGLWEFPGGKVEPGETPDFALARELHEELGIAVDPAALKPMMFTTGVADSRPLVLLLYEVVAWRGVPAALHASALAWHHPSTLRGLAMPPADRPLVDWLIARG